MHRCLALIALTCCLASSAGAELALASKVPGLEIVPLDTLPAAPVDQGDADYCDHLTSSFPFTDAANAVVAKGWLVTGEQPFGDLTAVSFVGRMTQATSGTCELSDGNVGLYSGDQLVALVYSSQPDALQIGSIRPFGDGLRIRSGDVVPGSTADLVRTGDAVSVVALASEEPVCAGTAIVPWIEGQPIDKARKLLLSAGWHPVPGDPAQQALGWAKDIAAAGVPEVDDCSGTGFAFCAYRYSSPAGELSVTTAGEIGEDGSLPTVTSYGVDCR
jgi:hypothetical protein